MSLTAGIPLNTELTEQVIFDHVVNHFKEQKVRGFEDLACKYRTANGNSCAVGACLTDEECAPIIAARRNSIAISTLILDNLCPDRFVPFEDLLSTLQRIHDCANKGLTAPRVSNDLRLMATQRSLNTDCITF